MKCPLQQNKLGSKSSGGHRAAISPCFFKGHAALRCSCPWGGFVLYCSLILVDFNCPDSEHSHSKNVNVPWLWKAEKTRSCVNWSLEKVAVFWSPAFSAGYGQLWSAPIDCSFWLNWADFSPQCGFTGVAEAVLGTATWGWTSCLLRPLAWQLHQREQFGKWTFEVCLFSLCLRRCMSITSLESNLGTCSCTIERVLGAAVTFKVWGLCMILVWFWLSRLFSL